MSLVVSQLRQGVAQLTMYQTFSGELKRKRDRESGATGDGCHVMM